jgi:hypothetical protein
LRSLQELDELLEESLRSSSHSQEKRNESEFAPGIQDLVEPLPHITVSISHGKIVYTHWKDSEDYVDALSELVVKFRTKLQIAFSTPDESNRELKIAIISNHLGLAKFVVAIDPLLISKNTCLCPATVIAKVMKCASRHEFVTLMLEIWSGPPFDHPDLPQTSFHYLRSLLEVQTDHYADMFLKHIGTLHIS